MTVSINKNKKQSWKQKCKLLTTYSSRSAKTEGSLATLKRKFTGVSLLCIFCIPSWSKIHDDQVDGKVANLNVNISRWFVVVVVVLVNSALMNLFLHAWKSRCTYGHIWIPYGPYLWIYQTLWLYTVCFNYSMLRITFGTLPKPCHRNFGKF